MIFTTFEYMDTMNKKYIDCHTDDLLKFLNRGVCNYLVVEEIVARLKASGFKELNRRDEWFLSPGDKRYVKVNDSALFAFVVGKGLLENGFRIISAHSDSPGFRVKPNCVMMSEGNIAKLNTEVYGGPILYTWFDRPLSLAGRVIVRTSNPFHPERKTVRFDEPLLTIPHLAIHFNRNVNEGNKLSKQKDMLPVLGHISNSVGKEQLLKKLISTKLEVDVHDIIDFDLNLYDITPACRLGLNNEFVSGGRLDDLSMVHAALTALISENGNTSHTRVMAIFDNEETGSGTKQGAASPVLNHLLERIVLALGGDRQEYLRTIPASFMISADNAHGLHPNYPEKHDPTNHPVLGGGPVIKINANCKYMTDADSSAVFSSLCEEAGVPYQYFVNHSDMAGGSTLGNILTSQIDLRGVDMGAPIWGMHSVRETASAFDHAATMKVFQYFYER